MSGSNGFRPGEASWRSGYAEDCKSLHPGSIPGEASKISLKSFILAALQSAACVAADGSGAADEIVNQSPF